jgi:hypothetical protein
MSFHCRWQRPRQRVRQVTLLQLTPLFQWSQNDWTATSKPTPNVNAPTKMLETKTPGRKFNFDLLLQEHLHHILFRFAIVL